MPRDTLKLINGIESSTHPDALIIRYIWVTVLVAFDSCEHGSNGVVTDY